MDKPSGNAKSSDWQQAEHMFTTRTMLILLVASGIGVLAGLVAGYTASTVDGLPIGIGIAAGLVGFTLTTFGAIGTLHRLIRP
jgi:hypothetical protein